MSIMRRNPIIKISVMNPIIWKSGISSEGVSPGGIVGFGDSSVSSVEFRRDESCEAVVSNCHTSDQSPKQLSLSARTCQ